MAKKAEIISEVDVLVGARMLVSEREAELSSANRLYAFSYLSQLQSAGKNALVRMAVVVSGNKAVL